ncbi:MAG: TonB family protein [Nitrospiria bacterium]
MKQMIIVSVGVHLFFIAFLFMIHYLNWRHPLIKPHVLSVQWVSLSHAQHEIQKTPPPERVKKLETAPPLKTAKKNPAPVVPRFKPAIQSQVTLPLPAPAKKAPPISPVQPVSPKVETPPPTPQVEVKKEEVPPVLEEPQKIEIAPISAIDPTYVERVKRTVDMNWTPPAFSGDPKEVTVSFEVLRNGLVRNPKIVKSSKDSFFDMAALRAVFESRRFGQLPPDYPSISVEITCTFSQNKGS